MGRNEAFGAWRDSAAGHTAAAPGLPCARRGPRACRGSHSSTQGLSLGPIMAYIEPIVAYIGPL